MSERIRGGYDDALYKSTFTLLYFTAENEGEFVLPSRLVLPVATVNAIVHESTLKAFTNCVYSDRKNVLRYEMPNFSFGVRTIFP